MRHTFASGTRLTAVRPIVVFATASASASCLTSAVVSNSGSLHVGNSRDTVRVRNAAGSQVHAVACGAPFASTDGVSMNSAPAPAAPAAVCRYLLARPHPDDRRVT